MYENPGGATAPPCPPLPTPMAKGHTSKKEFLKPVAVGNRMLLGMQDFDFCPTESKFTQISPNFSLIAPSHCSGLLLHR